MKSLAIINLVSVQLQMRKRQFFDSLKYGLYEVKYWIEVTIDSLKMLFCHRSDWIRTKRPGVGIVDVVETILISRAKPMERRLYLHSFSISAF